jgi:hypothetical protein
MHKIAHFDAIGEYNIKRFKTIFLYVAKNPFRLHNSRNNPNLNLSNIDWTIVGGESGWRARPMKEEWVTDIRRQCQESNVAFFFKQWGGVNKKRNGRVLEGKTWDEMPRQNAKSFEKLPETALF